MADMADIYDMTGTYTDVSTPFTQGVNVTPIGLTAGGGNPNSVLDDGSLSSIWNNITSGKYNDAISGISKILSGASTYGTAGQLTGLTGLSYLLNKIGGGGGSPAFAGYKGSIPSYTATREQTPYSTTTMTNAAGQTVPRRPGSGGITYFNPTTYTKNAADGGLMSGYPTEAVLRMADGGTASLGSYSDGGRLLKGPGDGVSDSIPAVIGDDQPARLANNEFVIPARIVSEIGNGSTDAGARKLYAMMERVQKKRSKTVGKNKVAVDSKAHKELDRL